jgi:flavin-dependent thymidylate synthase
MTQVLDQGYVTIVESWGSDKQIIEAARMSTDKGFLGWGDSGMTCKMRHEVVSKQMKSCQSMKSRCNYCNMHPIHIRVAVTITKNTGDEKLLAYLYKNRHMTPFEMAGMILEVKAPIVVFREWHRHRTQSYNEMSARYVPLPDENYMPTRQRIIEGVARAAGNRQAQGAMMLNTFTDRQVAGAPSGRLRSRPERVRDGPEHRRAQGTGALAGPCGALQPHACVGQPAQLAPVPRTA